MRAGTRTLNLKLQQAHQEKFGIEIPSFFLHFAKYKDEFSARSFPYPDVISLVSHRSLPIDRIIYGYIAR